MKRIAFLIFLSILSVSGSYVNAGGINKMFVQRNAGDECVFFVYSQRMPGCDNIRKEVKHIDYDFTYAQRTDSVSMLMTVEVSQSMRNITGVISSDSIVYSSPVELIYVKSKGDTMQYRMRLMMPFDEFEAMYASATDPFVLTIRHDNSIQELCFRYNPHKWESYRKKMCEIIELIKLNTGK